MNNEPHSFKVNESDKEVSKFFEQNDLISAAVVNDKNELIGRITIDKYFPRYDRQSGIPSSFNANCCKYGRSGSNSDFNNSFKRAHLRANLKLKSWVAF